jgi:hypothetical protein
MKSFLLISILILTATTVFSQTKMPEAMANSLLVIRQDVLDMGNTTVGQFFLNRKFKKVGQLDGTYTTAKYGDSKIDGNEYTLNIDVFNSDRKNITIAFVLLFQGETTLLETAKIINYKTGQNAESSEFEEKIQILQVFMKLLEK